MKKPMIIATIAFVAAAGIVPAHAQYLDSYLENQRWDNLRRHQQAGAGQIKRKSRKTRKTNTRKTTQRKVVVRYPQVQVNGKALQSPVAAVERDGHTFVPMRSIFEALGATVTYDKEQHLITAERNGSGIQITLAGGDSSKMKGNQAAISKGELPYTHNGTTMVPLRFVSEQIGAKVKYTARPKTPLIEIESKN